LFLHRGLASEFVVGQSLADNLRQGTLKSFRVALVILAVIVSERLLIKIAKQVEWLDAHIRSANPTLQQASQIFHTVRVHTALNVSNGMVNHLMLVLVHALVAAHLVAVEKRARLHVRSDNWLDCPSCSVRGRR